MATNLLVVTPSPSFGELIRRSLEETENYRVFVVNNKATAIVRADEESCRMAFLDLDMGEQWVEEVGQSLRTVLPTIELFVLATDDTPPALDAIRPWTLVRKPFHPPDLLLTVTQRAQIPSSPMKKEDMSNSNLPWLNDVSKAAQHLTRLTLESSAQAALITRNGELWAYAGQLPQSAAEELAKTLARNLTGQNGSDLLRFIRLESTKEEHMLYATALAEGMQLAMVFDAETPFSTIRSQASQLANSLGDTETKEQKSEKPAWPQPSMPEASSSFPSEVEDEADQDVDLPPISEILTDVPAPDPRPVTEIPQMKAMPAVASNDKRPMESGETRRSIFSRELASSPSFKDRLVTEQGQRANSAQTLPLPTRSSFGNFEATVPSRAAPRPETPVRRPRTGELDETRPHTASEAVGRIILEPVSAGVYHLSYACLLVPRFTTHYMTGDIADRISEWLPNICISFGWRLEYLAVRPEYLQWIVNVPPATSPGYLMRVVRQHTSDKILAEFPLLRKENPSGDFWAPGYLIMGGTQPHPAQLVKDYMKQVRQRQGLEKRTP
jgi:REP element-mobilizing transposase RayT/DNA-binding response OmpR family regulator